MEFSQLFWVVVFLIAIWPLIKHYNLERTRLRLHRSFEEKHGSRLITIIHRQEVISILGIPISRYINIESSEQVLRAIRQTPAGMSINMVVHTPSGLVLATEQIAQALMRHEAKVTIFIPHYAMSGGTVIALAADEIVMDCNSILGPVDPQIGQYPAASIIQAVKQKDINHVDDSTLILADMAGKALKQAEEFVTQILLERMPERACELAKMLTEGRWTHDYPITCDKLADMGLFINTQIPTEIYELMELYNQPS